MREGLPTVQQSYRTQLPMEVWLQTVHTFTVVGKPKQVLYVTQSLMWTAMEFMSLHPDKSSYFK